MSRETNQNFELNADDPAQIVLANINAALSKQPAFLHRGFIDTQYKEWQRRQIQHTEWGYRRRRGKCPGGGKFNAWQIAYVVNALGAMLASLDASIPVVRAA